MLTIIVPGVELFDENNQEFTYSESVILELEYSLVSVSKWESIHEKPFLDNKTKSTDETFSYIQAMTLTPNIPPEVFQRMTQRNLEDIHNYIDAKMTATWFHENPNAPRSREIITAELIYYWMINFNIPVEFENWHLNRLLTLIKICNIKSAKPRKMSQSEVSARNRELNAQRRMQLGTRG